MLLLDTCTLLWLVGDPARLSSQATDLIRQRADSLFISAISAFEIAVKHRRGGLRLPMDPQEWIAAALKHHGVNELPVTCRIAALSASLPAHHNDPCDRMIVATAMTEDLTILSPDHLIRRYEGVRVEW